MKKFIKNNFKTLIVIIITAFICISGTAFAASRIFASDILYKEGTVEDALDDLYSKGDLLVSSSVYTAEDYSHIRHANVSVDLPTGKYICFYNALNSSWTLNSLNQHIEVNDPERTINVTGCDTYHELDKKNYYDTPQAYFAQNQNFTSNTYKLIFTCEVNNNKTLNIVIPEDSGPHSSFESFISCVPVQ